MTNEFSRKQKRIVERQLKLLALIIERRDFARAFEKLEELLVVVGDGSNMNEFRARILIQMANILNQTTHQEAELFGYTDRRRQAEKLAYDAILELDDYEEFPNYFAEALGAIAISKWYSDLGEAKNNFLNAVEILKPVRDHYQFQYAQTLQNLALCYHTLENYEKAIELFSEAKRIAKENAYKSMLQNICRQLANVYGDKGQFMLAGNMLDKVRPAEHASAEERIRWQHARALIFMDEGDFKKADALFDATHGDFESLSSIGPEQGAALTTAAMFKLENGWSNQAKVLLERAKKIDQKNAPFSFKINFLKAQINFSISQNDTKTAIKLVANARRLINQYSPNGHEQELELVLLEQKVVQLFDDNIQIERVIAEILPRDYQGNSIDILSGGRFGSLVVLIKLLIERSEDLAWAEKLLRHVFICEAARNFLDFRWIIFTSLGVLLARRKNDDSAILSFKMAVETIGKITQPIPFHSPQRKSILEARKEPLVRLNELLIKHGRFVEAENASWQLANGAVEDVLPNYRDNAQFSSELLFSEIEEKWVRKYYQAAQLAHKFHNGSGSNENGGFDVTRDQHLSKIDKLFGKIVTQELFVDGCEKNHEDKNFPTTEQGSAVLRLVNQGDDVIVFFTSERHTKRHKVNISFSKFAVLVHQLHTETLSNSYKARNVSKQLYDHVIRPFSFELLLILDLDIVANGVFSRIPFAALFDGEKFLIQTVTISYPTSTSSKKPEFNKSENFLLAGTSLKHGSFPALVHVTKELEAIRRTNEHVAVLNNQKFNIKNLQMAMRKRPDVVHLATHFQLKPGSPKQSYLLLGDGKKMTLSMMGSERFEWKGVSLVFLSACETGTMDHFSLEGGTIAAFLQSLGAKWVVATLWPVIDQATARLVEFFYRQISMGVSPPQALQIAQNKMLAIENSQTVSMAAPLNWSGFKVFSP